MLVAMATNTLIRIFWSLRSVLQDSYGSNALIARTYVKLYQNDCVCGTKDLSRLTATVRVLYTVSIATGLERLERTKQLNWLFLIMFWIIFLEREVFSSNL